VSKPRITVGLPIYQATEHIEETLRCLQSQTYGDFEAIISVDGGDTATAEKCEPFLTDRRFRMVVQPHRLDWFGNLNWLLQQPLQEFFCFRQHDDTTAPEFFQTLLDTADRAPQAAIVYSDCQWTGGRNDIEIVESITGDPLQRLLAFIELIPAAPVRGLIRREAVAQAGLVRSDEFRGLTQVFTWLAKVLRWGDFIRVPLPIYYRLDHPNNYHKHWIGWSEEKRRAAWTTLFTGLLEAALPACATPQERAFMLHIILDRVVVTRPARPFLYTAHNDSAYSGRLIAECFHRLRHEGNSALLDDISFLGAADFQGSRGSVEECVAHSASATK
jgi:glycosyltransferase involved in cell wall biosynthesis